MSAADLSLHDILADPDAAGGLSDPEEEAPVPIAEDLPLRVEWAVRSEEVKRHLPAAAEGQKTKQEKLVDLLTNVVPPHAVPGVLRMMNLFVNSILATHPEIRASWEAYTPQNGNTKSNGGYADLKLVARLGGKDSRRLVARVPIPKGFFLGIYFARVLWTEFEARDLDETVHNALLTLEWYNNTIPLEDWLVGKRVADAGVVGRGRSCWMACGNTANAEDDDDHNAYIWKDGRCYAHRDIHRGEEIRFFYKLHESIEYQPPVPRDVNLAAMKAIHDRRMATQKQRRGKRKQQAGGGGAKTVAVATVTAERQRVPAVARVVATGDAAAAAVAGADQKTNEE